MTAGRDVARAICAVEGQAPDVAIDDEALIDETEEFVDDVATNGDAEDE